jgi:hypothetical protein
MFCATSCRIGPAVEPGKRWLQHSSTEMLVGFAVVRLPNPEPR